MLRGSHSTRLHADRRRNAEFIEEMIADPLFAEMVKEPEDLPHSHSHNGGHSHHSHSYPHGAPDQPRSEVQRDNDAAQDKVRSTLRSFVRDWSVEGKPERDACYTPVLEALNRHFPLDNAGENSKRQRGDIKVLVPGCGLGRLAMEIAAEGELAVLSQIGSSTFRVRIARQRVLDVHAPRLSFCLKSNDCAGYAHNCSISTLFLQPPDDGKTPSSTGQYT